MDYYKAETPEEAVGQMGQLTDEGLQAVYYAGGTEIVTNIRKGALKVDAFIDLKGIPEMHLIEVKDDKIILGANVTLNQIIEHPETAFLKPILDKIADHTVRNVLTLGGNICGRLPYREAVLPLLALDADIEVCAQEGVEIYKLRDLFDKRLKLPKGTFLYRIHLLKNRNTLFSRRETEHTAVDYPILHTVLYSDDKKRTVFMGISGFAAFPIYSVVDRKEETTEAVVKRMLQEVEPLAKSDDRAGADYRLNLLQVHLNEWLGGKL